MLFVFTLEINCSENSYSNITFDTLEVKFLANTSKLHTLLFSYNKFIFLLAKSDIYSILCVNSTLSCSYLHSRIIFFLVTLTMVEKTLKRVLYKVCRIFNKILIKDYYNNHHIVSITIINVVTLENLTILMWFDSRLSQRRFQYFPVAYRETCILSFPIKESVQKVGHWSHLPTYSLLALCRKNEPFFHSLWNGQEHEVYLLLGT